MKSRQNKIVEHVDNHRWVVSYADFITLLFAFFVVMYAISSVNDSKYKSLSEGMKSAFNKKDQNKATQSTDTLKDGPEEKKTKGTYKDGLDNLNKSLSVLENGDYKVNRRDGWVELEIKAGSLFDSGDAELKAEAMVKLLQLANIIKNISYPVIVEGYTDNIPIETVQFPSNWELSATRAATVGRVLNGYGVSANRILVTGYGEQYPVADNVTEAGRSQNRRVNIVIAKNRKVDRLLNPGFGQSHTVIFGNAGSNSQINKQNSDKKERK